MLSAAGKSSVTATMSYEINGTLVSISVPDAGNQLPGGSTLSCTKSNGYVLDALSSYGEFAFTFYTDSLQVGTYTYLSSYGPMYITDFNNTDEFVYGPTDSVSFNVTKYQNGYISGNFSGQLTPMISAGYPNNTYGVPGSVSIKNGTFSNVPIFY